MNSQQWLNPDCQIKPSQYTSTLIKIGPVFSDWGIESVRSMFENTQGWAVSVPWQRFVLEVNDTVHPAWSAAALELEQFFARQGYQYRLATAKLFFDVKGYATSPHWDHPGIAAMMQVYIAPQNLTQPGTVFNDPIIDLVEFRPNHGYINLNWDLKTHESAQVARGYRASIAFGYVPK